MKPAAIQRLLPALGLFLTAASCGAEPSVLLAEGAPGAGLGAAESGRTVDGDAPNASGTEAHQKDPEVIAQDRDLQFEFPAIEIQPVVRALPGSEAEAYELFESLRVLFDSSNLPQPLSASTTREGAWEFARAVRFLREQRASDVAFLEGFRGADVPGTDERTAGNVENRRAWILERLTKYLPNELERIVDQSRMQLGGQVEGRWFIIEKGATVDMDDASQVRNVLCNELLTVSREEAIRVASDAADVMVLLDGALGAGALGADALGGESEWVAKRGELRALIAAYRSRLEGAVEAIALPQDIGDDALRRIAEEVLANEELGLPARERLIVNAPKRSESRTEATLDWEAETVTRVQRRWDEFQVATVERHGDRLEIWFNTLVFFHEGPTTVRKGRWMLGERHYSSPVSEARLTE